ncbi:protein D3 [Ixodes scapularis]
MRSLSPRLLVLLLLVDVHLCAWRRSLDKKEADLLAQVSKSGIVPDLIDAVPDAVFEVAFPAGKVLMGTALTPHQASEHPTDLVFPRDEGAVYAIAMLDPDAPSRSDPKFRPILHWLVVNVAAGDVKAPVNLRRATVLMNYRGPKPPLGSGPHRYVFLAYKQRGTIASPHTLTVPPEKRFNFNMNKFALEHGLGRPVAVNFFLAEDAYVDGQTPIMIWTLVVFSVLAGFVGRLFLLSS